MYHYHLSYRYTVNCITFRLAVYQTCFNICNTLEDDNVGVETCRVSSQPKCVLNDGA
jgi:hypothetical protein